MIQKAPESNKSPQQFSEAAHQVVSSAQRKSAPAKSTRQYISMQIQNKPKEELITQPSNKRV